MSLLVGLTGSIATGKSTVSTMLKESGLPVIDADQIARDIVKPGQAAYKEIVRLFGESILLPDQTLNRPNLGALIFADETKRNALNQVMHPAIREEMLRQRDHHIKSGEKCIVLDIPLLFENKLTDLVEKIIVVHVDEVVQLDRLKKRNNYTEEEALQRIQAQMPVKDKAALADAVINNNGRIAETKKQVEQLMSKWKMK